MNTDAKRVLIYVAVKATVTAAVITAAVVYGRHIDKKIAKQNAVVSE